MNFVLQRGQPVILKNRGKVLNNSSLHYQLIRAIMENGFAPSVEEFKDMFNVSRKEVVRALNKLAEDHGVVLHPHQPEVWVIHPFSLAPTIFHVKAGKGQWWASCAWCSLGIAALVEGNVQISTTIGAEGKQVTINIVDGQIQDKDYLIHFPVPMQNAWDNVIFTCSNILAFENKEQIESWSGRHRFQVGDIQPIDKIWEFSKEWYGNHLDPNWKKWTVDEAKQIFARFNLHGRIWNLDDSNNRF